MRVFFMRHIQGESRHQSTLFPESLDEYISEDNPVRVIDAFIDFLDMNELGFTQAVTKDTGRKPYHPSDLLKLYTYGYLNQVRSTRRLERECHRNIEVLWLMKRLTPDFKTIANFRQQNEKAIGQACRAFINFCRKAKLLDGRLVAIDGSKFKAAASMSKTYNHKQLDDLQKRLNRQIEGYLTKLAQSEQREPEEDAGDIKEAIAALKKRQKTLSELAKDMEQKGSKQCCETEPEAKRMRSGREGVIVGYNIQTAVDVDTGVIVHYDINSEGNDHNQLSPMAEGAKSALEHGTLEVIADTGYSNGEHLARCEEQGITASVPAKRAVNNQGDYFQKGDFQYDEVQDHFICPAGKALPHKTINSRDKLHLYGRSGCSQCSLQDRCTKADKRWVSRHFYEKALDRSQRRVDENPMLMRLRATAAERPYAQLKHIMGIRRFLCWGINGAKAEMGLSVMAYNLNRLINELGVKKLMQLI